MKYTKNDVVKLIQKTVFEVTQIKLDSEDISLLDTSLGIYPADFLYIFDLLEKELKVPATDVFKSHSYDVMVVDKLSDALLELMK